MSNQLLTDIDLWEIWVEFDPSDPKHFGTLYVHGEVLTDYKHPRLPVKKIGSQLSKLILQLPSRSHSVNRTKEVLYSEPIRNLNQYTCVEVYVGNELIISLNELEILI